MVEQQFLDSVRTQNGRRDWTRSRRPTTGNFTFPVPSILEMQSLSQTKGQSVPCGKPHITWVGKG
jgi:hypothetical protein